jgi:hypothetical protein
MTESLIVGACTFTSNLNSDFSLTLKTHIRTRLLLASACFLLSLLLYMKMDVTSSFETTNSPKYKRDKPDDQDFQGTSLKVSRAVTLVFTTVSRYLGIVATSGLNLQG